MTPTEKNPPLFNVHTPPPKIGEIQSAVIEMFQELEHDGVLGPIERAKRAALIKAAAAVDVGMEAPKIAVSTSNVFKQLMEGLETLPRPYSGTDSDLDAYDATVSRLTLAAVDGVGA